MREAILNPVKGSTANKDICILFDDATHTIEQVRAAFATIVEALPASIASGAELQRALRVDKMLAWRVFNLVRCSDSVAAARFLPGDSGIKMFLRAAETHGVPPGICEAAAQAWKAYKELIQVHADDREAFDMLLAAHSQQGRAEADAEYRRSAFVANRYVWGSWAKAQFRLCVVGPPPAAPAKADTVDMVTVGGYAELQHVRPGTRVVLNKIQVGNEFGPHEHRFLTRPLDAGIGTGEASPLLHDFCGPLTGNIQRVLMSDAMVDEIIDGPVGKTGAATYVTAEVFPDLFPRRRTEELGIVEHFVRVRIPCETLIFDQIAHRRTFETINAEVKVYSDLAGETSGRAVRSESERLPLMEAVEHLGSAGGVIHTPEIPRYNELVRTVCDRMDWPIKEFEVHRVRVRYPVTPSSVVVRMQLPQKTS